VGAQSVRPREGLLTEGVWDQLSLVPALVTQPGDDLRVLILGLGAGTVAWQIDALYADRRRVAIDGVELDPLVVEVGRRFFGLDRVETLRVHLGDARALLPSLPGPYDVIVVDAYRGSYIPFHLATREFFEACRDRLSPAGAIVLNVAAPRGASLLFDALERALLTAYPHAGRLGMPDLDTTFRNVVYVASRVLLTPPAPSRIPRGLGALQLTDLGALRPSGTEATMVLADDRAPVEVLVDRSILDLLDPGER
jgi:precorrin-6B methylase 2